MNSFLPPLLVRLEPRLHFETNETIPCNLCGKPQVRACPSYSHCLDCCGDPGLTRQERDQLGWESPTVRARLARAANTQEPPTVTTTLPAPAGGPVAVDGLPYDGAPAAVTGVLDTVTVHRNKADRPWAHGRIRLADPDQRVPFVIYPQTYAAAGPAAAALATGAAVRLTGRIDRRDGRPTVIVNAVEEAPGA